MKCQNLFSGEIKKNISVCRLLKILPRALSVNSNRNKLISHIAEDQQRISHVHIFGLCFANDKPMGRIL